MTPAVEGTYSPTVTVHDFVGATYPKTFQTVIAANPQQSVKTPAQRSYYAMLAAYWVKIAAITYRDAEACTALAPELPELAPVCLAYGLAYLRQFNLAEQYEAKAADPVDTSYTTIALPTPPSLTMPAPDPSWTAAQLAAYNALTAVLQTEDQIIGLSDAEITSVNRAEGAYQAGNTYWLQQQLAAQKQYFVLEALDQGDLQVQNIPFGSGLNVIYGANVKGNLQYENNAASIEIGLPPSFPPNVIGGDLQVQNNSASTQIYNDAVAGNLQIQNNKVSTQVFGNSVTNNLQCQNNKSITGRGNTAKQKQGQCSNF